MIYLFVITFLLAVTNAMNLPGLSPKDYKMGDPLDILMSYIETDGIGIAYDYYDMDFCGHDIIGPAQRYKTKQFGESLEIEHWI